MPTPILHDGRVRVFLSGRDAAGRSLPFWVDLDSDDLSVLDRSSAALFSLGAPGTFDEDGVMPSSVVRRKDGSLLMYYVGWNRSSGSVPYRVAIGCAESEDGQSFRRISNGPVLDRTSMDPIFVTTPFVVSEPWTMWYSTCTRWETVDGRLEPFYGLARATSPDGTSWFARTQVETSLDADAIARPAILESDDGQLILFCHRRAEGYRIQPEASYKLALGRLGADRVETVVDDLKIDDGGLSTEMCCYPATLRIKGRTLLLYNGDGFGHSGVGAAWIDDLDVWSK
ncbi:MAG: hypothetical protein R8J94_09705 [Acidimicrobiia bacterium]|nr:hypothetical protein [Acidimicrobiia bacterium]